MDWKTTYHLMFKGADGETHPCMPYPFKVFEDESLAQSYCDGVNDSLRLSSGDWGKYIVVNLDAFFRAKHPYKKEYRLYIIRKKVEGGYLK